MEGLRYHFVGMWSVLVLAAVLPVPLSGTFPEGVPSGSEIARWQRYSGHFTAAPSFRISYELFVDPRRQALYAITRYRLHSGDQSEPEDEVLIWNSRPGTTTRLLCFT